jgi:hypothetical protein
VKVYRTATGSYTEAELVVIVWRNAKQKKSNQSRFLETMTSENSPHPMAFPLEKLVRRKEWSAAIRVSSLEEVFDKIPETSRAAPMIVPLSVAEQAFGWSTFYIPTEYTE